ncbi:MAG: DUF4153 domain-containing protein [Sphingomonas sp.]|nr:DUF4153 domain-containing protein [Sphingomonas sp.]
MSERLDAQSHWPLRPWIMAAICAVAGLIFDWLTDYSYPAELGPGRQAAATFVAVGTLAFVITVELRRWVWAVAFAAGWAAVIALVGWFTAGYNSQPELFEWPFLSGLFAVLIAAPLFQTVRDEGAWRFPYERLHGHAWMDAVIGAASLFFTGISFLLAWLIAGLFDLIGIEFLTDLLKESWFGWMLAGFAFGSAVGLLRERDALLTTLQRLVMVVFSVLAPVLAAALVLFLASLPFTGLGGLWDSDVPATPLLLVAGAGAVLLTNAVIGNGKAERSPSKVLQWAAMALVSTVLPLAIIAALSLGQRIGQHGWTPERIWGVIAVGVAIAYGAASWWAVWRARRDFDDVLRPMQVRLAIGLCGLALLLALPIVDFGAISARSQIARLQNGTTAPDEFDWGALAFEFGPAGRKALERIRATGPGQWRMAASTALEAKTRHDVDPKTIAAGPPPQDLIVLPRDAVIPVDLRTQLLGGPREKEPFCSLGGSCRVFAQPGGVTFVVIMDTCATLRADRRDRPAANCTRLPAVYERRGNVWENVYDRGFRVGGNQPMSPAQEAESLRRESEALERGDVRVSPVVRRQLLVGGKPAGQFE